MLFLVVLLSLSCASGPADSNDSGDGNQSDGADPGDAADDGSIAPFVPAACIPGDSFSTARASGGTCAKPATIKTGMGGNGHSETWDGRVFLITKNTDAAPHTVGWVVRVLRPERIQTGAGGVLDFSNQAFSQEVILEVDGQNGSGGHNAHAMVRAPGLTENPYFSDEAGVASPTGTFLSYEVLIYAQNYEQESKLQVRRARFVIENPFTQDARPISATMLDAFVLVTTTEGENLRAIEPTLTFDGRLLIAQGHPDNDGKIDNLVYSYNPTPGALTGWSPYRFISDLYHLDRDTLIDGIALQKRYPIAQKPLKNADGSTFAESQAFPGAYPWISHDGTELVYMATVAGDNTKRPGERARRGGASVVGRFTNWITRHIDGPINPSRDGMTENSTVRLFFSSPGAFSTMWTPFRELNASPLPYTARGPAYPLFGSNTGDYSELSFEDFLDGNYVVALRMNDLVNSQGNVVPTATADTSGLLNNGVLEGAQFPIEYNGADSVIGAVGQGLYFPENGGVRVAHSDSLERLTQGFTAELYVERQVDLAQDEADRALDLLHKPGAFQLVLEETGLLSLHVWVGGEKRSLSSFGTPLPLGQYVHVAVSYEPATGTLRAYQAGALATQAAFAPGALDVGTSDLLVGPANQRPASPFVSSTTSVVLLDELRLSDVVRDELELAHAGYACAPVPALAAAFELPLGLRASDLRLPADSINTAAAQALGKQLFFDPRLSGSGEMACATCHMPDHHFSDTRATSLGNGQFLSRNSPSVFNRAFGAAQFWDGRAGSLEAQTIVPLENPEEMNLPLDQALAVLAALPGYASQFQEVFGKAPDKLSLEQALAAFQRSLLSGNSRVDRFEAGEREALSENEQRGRHVFLVEGRCVGCHSGSNFSDEGFHNNGAVCVGDAGRSSITGRARDLGLFKTPSLRDVARTGPYMHDGGLDTLEAVVDAYDQGGLHHNNVDAEIHPLRLTAEQKADLVAYLRALDGDLPQLAAPPLP